MGRVLEAEVGSDGEVVQPGVMRNTVGARQAVEGSW